MLLGAVTWGPACAAAHALNDWLRLGQLLRTFLISQRLLDESSPPQPGLQAKPWQQVKQELQAQRQQAALEQLQQQQQREEQEERAVRRRKEEEEGARQGELAGVFRESDDDVEFDQLPRRRQVRYNMT